MALKLIGTDLSLDWCLKEGYLMLRTDCLTDINKDPLYFFMIRVEDDATVTDIADESDLSKKLEGESWSFDLQYSSCWSLDILLEEYKELPKADQQTKIDDWANLSHQDILSIASDIDAYRGLDWEALNINQLK